MPEKTQQAYARTFRELFGLEYSPVALACQSATTHQEKNQKLRICRAILEAGRGKTLTVNKENNACFGAAWHLGFRQMQDPKILGLIKKFVVEGEKLFCSYQALDKLISQMEQAPDNSKNEFILAPLEKAEFLPQLVIFIVHPEAACRILTLVTFLDGIMPKIKVGGPTCRLSIIYPLVTQEVNLSFYDYTARKMCNVDKDKLLISVPYARIPKMVEAIDKCSAGTAKIEFPEEFKNFLQKSLNK